MTAFLSLRSGIISSKNSITKKYVCNEVREKTPKRGKFHGSLSHGVLHFDCVLHFLYIFFSGRALAPVGHLALNESSGDEPMNDAFDESGPRGANSELMDGQTTVINGWLQ